MKYRLIEKFSKRYFKGHKVSLRENGEKMIIDFFHSVDKGSNVPLVKRIEVDKFNFALYENINSSWKLIGGSETSKSKEPKKKKSILVDLDVYTQFKQSAKTNKKKIKNLVEGFMREYINDC